VKRRKPKTPYRIVGARGEWFAWRAGGLQHDTVWGPHVAEMLVRLQNGSYRSVRGILARTPLEALERLKRIEARAC